MDKMDSAEMCLRWKDHHLSQSTCFKSLLEDNCLVDCTIAAEGQYLKAHKLILSASSTYFQVLFAQESEKNPIVILKDIKFEELKALIEFVYCGEVKMDENRVATFLDIAKSLEIKGLHDIRGHNKAADISHDTNTDFIEENRDDDSNSSPQNNPASFYEENSCPLQDQSSNQSKRFENSSQKQEYQMVAENTYPLMHSLESSSMPGNTCSSVIQGNQPDIPVASASDIPQQNCSAVEKFSEIVKNDVKVEPIEEMILEPTIDVRTIVKERLRDLPTESDLIAMEDEAIKREENAHEDICLSFGENSHPSPNSTFMDLQMPAEHSNDQEILCRSNDVRTFAPEESRQVPKAEERAMEQATAAVDQTCGTSSTAPAAAAAKKEPKLHLQCRECPAVFRKWNSLRKHSELKHAGSTQSWKTQRSAKTRKRSPLPSADEAACGPTVASAQPLQVQGSAESGEPFALPSAVASSNADSAPLFSLGAAASGSAEEAQNSCRLEPSERKNKKARKNAVRRKFSCTECPFLFNNRFRLYEHMRKHSGERLICEFCGARWMYSSALRKHIDKNHGNEKYICEICGLCVVYLSNLQKHMERAHSEQKNKE